jgi:hypothetical protein
VPSSRHEPVNPVGPSVANSHAAIARWFVPKSNQKKSGRAANRTAVIRFGHVNHPASVVSSGLITEAYYYAMVMDSSK